MSSWSTPPPEETRGRQQWLALRLRDLRCAWAAAWRAFTPVVAWAVRLSAEKDEGTAFAAKASSVVDGQAYSTYDTRLAQLLRDATLQSVLEEVEQGESLGCKNETRLLNTDPTGPEVRVLEQLRDTEEE
ncbi:hypothetical protein ZWY2020_024698 [Hordeum vulgare]|nr:hypothetical protein ZWY2020_024698 [Hordeum vulgare]